MYLSEYENNFVLMLNLIWACSRVADAKDDHEAGTVERWQFDIITEDENGTGESSGSGKLCLS
jgi:hypothetical protein